MTETTRPNVLLICTDHWGGLLTRRAGHPTVMTPTIDQLSRCGVTFTNAYTACPSCIPARRSLMTGTSARTHGDRVFNERAEMPALPTMAQCFRDAGYQAIAVGKLHVHPQRDRIGFDEVILNEEGRHHLGDLAADDWEMHLADHGFAGQEYASDLNNNDYVTRAWHLPEDCHSTNWTAAQMCRAIHRRDPRKPGFWYMSFVGPHPPVWPLQAYLDLYHDVKLDEPVMGEWVRDPASLPHALRAYPSDGGDAVRTGLPHEIDLSRRAFYATITHIDHQIRVVIGYLREQGLLDNTILAFTADHGDMLGDHGRWGKTVLYEMSAKVPLVVVPRKGDERMPVNTDDARLAELRDIMPTLLDLAGLPIPPSVEGLSLLRDQRRAHLYGEHWEGDLAWRMVRDDRYKLIYYAVGNRRQLFDLQNDPRETRDLTAGPAHTDHLECLTQLLIAELYGGDEAWVRDGKLIGLPDKPAKPKLDRGLSGQRGIRFI